MKYRLAALALAFTLVGCDGWRPVEACSRRVPESCRTIWVREWHQMRDA